MSRFDEKGFDWAQKEATKSQLSRLTKLARQISPTDWERYFTAGADAYTAAERLFFALEPNKGGDRRAAAKFWGNNLDDRSVQEFAEVRLPYLDANDATTPAI